MTQSSALSRHSSLRRSGLLWQFFGPGFHKRAVRVLSLFTLSVFLLNAMPSHAVTITTPADPVHPTSQVDCDQLRQKYKVAEERVWQMWKSITTQMQLKSARYEREAGHLFHVYSAMMGEEGDAYSRCMDAVSSYQAGFPKTNRSNHTSPATLPTELSIGTSMSRSMMSSVVGHGPKILTSMAKYSPTLRAAMPTLRKFFSAQQTLAAVMEQSGLSDRASQGVENLGKLAGLNDLQSFMFGAAVRLLVNVDSQALQSLTAELSGFGDGQSSLSAKSSSLMPMSLGQQLLGDAGPQSDKLGQLLQAAYARADAMIAADQTPRSAIIVPATSNKTPTLPQSSENIVTPKVMENGMGANVFVGSNQPNCVGRTGGGPGLLEDYQSECADPRNPGFSVIVAWPQNGAWHTKIISNGDAILPPSTGVFVCAGGPGNGVVWKNGQVVGCK